MQTEKNEISPEIPYVNQMKTFTPHMLPNRPNSLVENPFPPHSNDKKKFGKTRFLSSTWDHSVNCNEGKVLKQLHKSKTLIDIFVNE